jgi:bifunctional polynucleotide phosphatase/kinase
MASLPAAPATTSQQAEAAVPRPELLLLAAPPACGKSTLARRFEQGGYCRVNQDTLGSFDKCAAAAKSALLAGQSVCVDNTNMDLNTRAKWVQLAKHCDVVVSTTYTT